MLWWCRFVYILWYDVGSCIYYDDICPYTYYNDVGLCIYYGDVGLCIYYNDICPYTYYNGVGLCICYDDVDLRICYDDAGSCVYIVMMSVIHHMCKEHGNILYLLLYLLWL